jgi:hypothetical protein
MEEQLLEKLTKQYFISPSAGKRLIAKSFLHIPSIINALENGTIAIIAGTTNGYIVEEILKKLNQDSEFSRKSFYRTITLPTKHANTDIGRINDENHFPGDVVIVEGKWEKGKTIFDVADNLKKGDVIIKGANAVNLDNMQTAIYIGSSNGGTIIPTLQATLGRRAELFLPVGLEKRISGDINEIAKQLNSSKQSGLRYLPVSGNVVTELESIKIVTGADAELIAGGGVCGAEGSYWIAVTGDHDQISNADNLIKEIRNEPNFKL